MSKIGSDNIKTQTFAELDVLADWLARSIISTQEEFQRKSEFVTEQQAKISRNENDIFQIRDDLNTLTSTIAAEEVELERLQYDLEYWEKFISQLETDQGVPYCNCRPTYKTDREKFMAMIQETDARIQQMQGCIENIDSIKMCCLNRPYPYDLIFRILNCHQKTLMHTERQLDLILDKLLIIASDCTQ